MMTKAGFEPGPLPQPLDGHRSTPLRLEALSARPAQPLAPDPDRRDLRAHRRDAARARGLRCAADAACRRPHPRLAVPVARLRGRPVAAADPARDHRARPGLHQVRPAALDPPRRRRPRARRPALGAAGQAAAVPARRGARHRRGRARPAGRRRLRRLRAAGRRRLARAGPPRDRCARPAASSRSRCCAPVSSAPSCATSTPSTSPPAWSSSSPPSPAGCARRP